MRAKLSQMQGLKDIFTGRLIMFACKKGEKTKSVALVEDVKCGEILVADHLWLPRYYFYEWQLLGLLTFRARVVPYVKNHAVSSKALDFTLTHIRMISVDLPEYIEEYYERKFDKGLHVESQQKDI